ncbi:Woronin body major protein [Paramyrothecium foliicola]|nr:Woronin body major protein [Paramyrothecium foliicola]
MNQQPDPSALAVSLQTLSVQLPLLTNIPAMVAHNQILDAIQDLRHDMNLRLSRLEYRQQNFEIGAMNRRFLDADHTALLNPLLNVFTGSPILGFPSNYHDFTLLNAKVANLDFEARVPVPFSIFPSTYRDSEAQTQISTHTHEELEIKLPAKQPAGREGQNSSSYSANAELPPRKEYREEEIRITREEERYRRPGSKYEHHEHHHIHAEHRPAAAAAPAAEYHDTHIDIDVHPHSHSHPQPYSSPIDVAEREYRERFRPSYNTTVDAAAPQPQYRAETTYANEFTVDASIPRSAPQAEVKFSEETVEPARYTRADQKSKMGYYDEDGHYHSFRQGVHKLADKITNPRGYETHVDIDIHREKAPAPGPVSRGPVGGSSGGGYVPNTVTIPCHHIRLGDFLVLQGRPCQVIRISTSSATGQYRYLGVDLFTKQLHEESSFISNPAPSVVVQTMLGPVFKQYRVLDMQDGYVTAMTETGDVKPNLTVIDQSNLWSRLANAFESGRGSVRILVLNDQGRELAVDMKVIHGSRL